MNKLVLIGNLTRDPQLRPVQTSNGMVSVCNFSIAVNRRSRTQNGQQETDYFNITTWRGLADNCFKYLAKGRKVCVTGPVSCRTYQAQDGTVRACMEVNADEVEFLSSGSNAGQQQNDGYVSQDQSSAPSGFTAVEQDELPF